MIVGFDRRPHLQTAAGKGSTFVGQPSPPVLARAGYCLVTWNPIVWFRNKSLSEQFFKGTEVMLHYAVVFLVIALIAALFGFGGIAAGAAGIAKILFVVFLIGAVVTFLMSAGRRI